MTTPLPLRSQLKRESIIAAGRELFLAHGYQGTSVDQIAASAEVSKQTVYKHFGDKKELLLAIVGTAVDGTVSPFLERITSLSDTTDIEGDLTALAVEYLRSVLAEPVVQLRRLVVGEANSLPELAELYYRTAPARTLGALADAFALLHGRGMLHAPEPRVAAEHFAVLVVGRSIDQALFFGGQKTYAELDVDRTVGAAVYTFLAAYRPDRNTSRPRRR